MNTKFTFLALFSILSAGGASSALAHPALNDGAAKRLAPSEAGAPSARQRAPYGYASAGPAERVLEIGPGTRYLNVTRLETVRIKRGDTSVVWTFDTLGTKAFPLSKIVPDATGVTVYVKESPLYRGG